MKARIGRSLSILHRQADHFLNEALKPYSINRSQMSILILLSRQDGLSQAQLNEHFLFNKASITKMLTSLEASGCIKRSASTQDKRKNFVYLTQKGSGLIPKIKNATSAWEAELTKDLTAAEQDILRQLLSKILDSTLQERR